jgi:phosphoribosyl-ATP pyrophosphohydrolase
LPKNKDEQEKREKTSATQELHDDGVKVVTAEVVEPEFELLSEEEERYRQELEREVENSFYVAGKALNELRNRKLYRSTHKTFEEYAKDRFGFHRRYPYYLIQAAEVVDNLTEEDLIEVLPAKESQCRPLTNLTPDVQRAAWTEAVKEAEGKVPTAKQVKTAINRIIEKPFTGVPFHVGEVCRVESKDEPSLRGRNGCWAIVTEVYDFSCDIELWNGSVQLVKPEFLKSLDYDQFQQEAIRQLCQRIKALREQMISEEASSLFLSYLGKIRRSELTEIEEQFLLVLEAQCELRSR